MNTETLGSEPKHYCLYCGWNSQIIYFETKIGLRWVCSCGIQGLKGSFDEPKLLPLDSQGEIESDFDFCKRIFKEEDLI